MKYFRIFDDINYPNRWYLGDLSHEDNWQFTYGKVVKKDWKELSLDVYQDGDEMDFTFTEAYSVPIVSESFKKTLTGVDGLDFFPVTINKRGLKENYHVMVVTRILEAVDETRSDFDKFEVDDEIRPDKAGEYSSFLKLVIDPRKAKGTAIFRLRKFDIAVIVDERIKSRITEKKLSGIVFEEV